MSQLECGSAAAGTAAIQMPSGSILAYRKANKPALGGAWGFVGRFHTYSAAGIAASRGDTRSRRLPPPHPPAWRAWHRTGLGIGDRLVRAEALAPRCKKTCASGEVQACRLADQRIHPCQPWQV